MLDFEYAKALAEVVLDTTCSEKEREVRLECSTQIFGRANAYLKKGFLPDVVEAFFVRKMKGLPLVSTKQDMQDFLKVSTPIILAGNLQLVIFRIIQRKKNCYFGQKHHFVVH